MKKILLLALAAAALVAPAAHADSTPGTLPTITAASGTPIDKNDSHVSVTVALQPVGGTDSYTVCWLDISPGTGGYTPPGGQIIATPGSWQGDLPIAPGATYSAQLLMVKDDATGAGTCPATFDPTADFYYLSNTVAFTIAAPPPPTASFTTLTDGLTISATDTSSAPTPATIESAAFDFGDGTTETVNAGATATHAYLSAGTYTIGETVTDTNGDTASTSMPITVTAPPTVTAPTPTPAAPQAAFAMRPTGLTVAFTDTSIAGSAPIASVSFIFGDGENATIKPGGTATHAYLSAGTFTVVEIVTDTSGLTGQASTTIAISAFGGTPALREQLAPTLTRKIGQATRTTIAVYCVTSWGQARPERVDGKKLGLSIVGSHQINISNTLCKSLRTRKPTWLALLVAGHETEHALGIRRERTADCGALHLLPRLERALHVKDTGQRAGARRYVLRRWHSCA